VGLKILAGLGNNDARGEVYMNLMPPPLPKLPLFSYFVLSGRLLLEGLRAFHSQIYFAKLEKSPKLLFLQGKSLQRNGQCIFG
jgi:hypothetical protein